MKRRTVFKWVNRFRSGRESVNDDAQERRSTTSRIDENVKRVYDLMMSDHRITTRMIAAQLGISRGSVQIILKENLNMWKLYAKFVPKVVSEERKQRRVACCKDYRRRVKRVRIFSR